MANRNQNQQLGNYPDKWGQSHPLLENIPARVRQHNEEMFRQGLDFAGPNPLASKPTHRGKR